MPNNPREPRSGGAGGRRKQPGSEPEECLRTHLFQAAHPSLLDFQYRQGRQHPPHVVHLVGIERMLCGPPQLHVKQLLWHAALPKGILL